jgi:hypothetical protein
MRKIIHLIAASAILVCLGLVFFSSGGRDDAHISYWPSYTLSNWGKIVNYNGEFIEQSTSLLYVIILAFFHRLFQTNIVTIGAIFSIIAGIATLLFTQRLSEKIFRDENSPYFVTYLLGTNVYFVYWSFSALETTLAALCVVYLIYGFINYLLNGRGMLHLIFGLSLYLLVRPESIFMSLVFLAVSAVIIFLGQFSLHNKSSQVIIRYLKNIALITFIILVIFAFILVIRYHYFGNLFPCSVMAKTGGLSKIRVFHGLRYLLRNGKSLGIFLIGLFVIFSSISLFRLIFSKIHPIDNVYLYKIVLFAYLLTNSLFIITTGGDWMEGGRFLVPILPLMYIFSIIYLTEFKFKKWSRYIVLFLIFSNVISVLHFAMSKSTGQPLWTYRDNLIRSSYSYSFFEKSNRVNLRALPIIEKLDTLLDIVYQYKDPPVVIMSGQAGMVIFHICKKHYGKVHFVDLRGLTTKHFIECPVTKSVSKTTVGLAVPYSYFFNNLPHIRAECPNIPIPDIIFDQPKCKNVPVIPILIENGYEIVYKQSGVIPTRSVFFPGTRVGADRFIAIRLDLFDKIKSEIEIEHYLWNSYTHKEKITNSDDLANSTKNLRDRFNPWIPASRE